MNKFYITFFFSEYIIGVYAEDRFSAGLKADKLFFKQWRTIETYDDLLPEQRNKIVMLELLPVRVFRNNELHSLGDL